MTTPCASPKRGIPWELKYKYAIDGYSAILKAFMYGIREKYGAQAAIEMKERIDNMDNRVRRFVTGVIKIFNIEGNDATTIGEVFDVWNELCGQDVIVLERSKTTNSVKVNKCPWTTEPKDLSGWCNSFMNLVGKTINPKTTLEFPQSLCAGDTSCDIVWKIKE